MRRSLRLFDHLNDAIDDARGELGRQRRGVRQITSGEPYVPVVIEPIANTNFYEGHRPSLIQAPIAKYPNVLRLGSARDAAPGVGSCSDHTDVCNNLLFIEVMCKSAEKMKAS